MRGNDMKLCVTVVLQVLLVGHVESWNDGGVLLQDIQALTLYRNRYTTARRSSPVPQLKCVGGTAGCQAFVPEVVQCLNRGWDGIDIQWECKTDMDNKYRFGRIEVSCEGYTHPDDSHVLKGSCGLEYTLDLTEEGQRRGQGSWGSQSGGFGGFGKFASSVFGSFSGSGQQSHRQSSYPSSTDDSGSLLIVGLLLVVAYVIYKMFLSGNTFQTAQDGGAAGNPYSEPPPPGFKPDYTGYPGTNQDYGFHSDYTHRQRHPGGWTAPNTGGTGGGFWTGMGTGGVLGYLFGRQRNQPNNYPGFYDSRPHRDYSSPSSPSSSSSSGTRTASGFGGTKRR
ncbi:store-operated calcium entry-associated regulatory factor [Mugil cephalus]|uniref:store-operated calcium entry-associated regulatory factor n=1 Tax=Mugil cephalus TaxID=48193 RepID=UPI001FB688E3|nr:store-operated calcium entry-associated regulatory factor [Mugil cephalus]